MVQALLILLISGLLQVAVFPGEESGTSDHVHAKNIILLIGDGMGTAQVSAGLTITHGKLNMATVEDIGFSRTSAADDYVTDSGAGGTAIAIGRKTYSRAIGVDRDTIAQTTILEHAERNGKSTGLAVTSQVTHATPASFVAHQKTRYDYESIALDILVSGIDVFIGGGRDHFDRRSDSADLTPLLEAKGYQVVHSLDEMNGVRKGKVAGLLYPGAPPRYSEGRGDMLPVAVGKAIEILSADPDGFFLLVEGSQIDWGGHDKDADYMMEELLDFDRAVGVALEFARRDGNTLVIVTADHETGGMSLTDGNNDTGSVEAAFTTSNHTGSMVPVFSFGPAADKFRGIYENTDLFEKMMEAFGFKSPEKRS